MKTIIEFGVRGGMHSSSITLPSAKKAAELAAHMVMVLSNDNEAPSARVATWKLTRHMPRKSWQSSTHFVSISLLDGVPRGPAAAKLWRKPDTTATLETGA